MNASLDDIDAKLRRAKTRIDDIESRLGLFTKAKLYTARVQPHVNAAGGIDYASVIAVRNRNTIVPDPSIMLTLRAAEAAYHLRSALDHLVHQLVTLNGNAAVLEQSRNHQFPIFHSRHTYGAKACRLIYGVASDVAAAIENAQPYKRTPNAPKKDPLWILQDINNTDKHRSVPLTVYGLGEVRGHDSSGNRFSRTSRDVMLEEGKELYRFSTPTGRYDDIEAEVVSKIAFKQAMTVGSSLILDMGGILRHIQARVQSIIEEFRPKFT